MCSPVISVNVDSSNKITPSLFLRGPKTSKVGRYNIYPLRCVCGYLPARNTWLMKNTQQGSHRIKSTGKMSSMLMMRGTKKELLNPP